MRILLFIAVFLSATSLFAADPSEGIRWSDIPENTLGVKLGVQTPALDYELSGAGDKEIRYSSRVASQTFLGLTYGPFGLSGSFSNSPTAEDKAKYGTTRASDFQFRFYGRRFTWEFFYQNYKGYYVDNSEQIDPSLNSSSPRLQRPDLSSIHAGAQMIYVFTPERFHLGGAYDGSVRQTESGGSWIGFAAVSNHQITADTPLVPDSLKTDFGKIGTFQEGEFLTLRIGGGYGYTFVMKENWFLSGVLSYAIGPQRQRSLTSRGWQTSMESTVGTNVKLGAGYNGEKYLGGITLILDQNQIPVAGGLVNADTKQATLYFGMRFGDVRIPGLSRDGKPD